MKKAFFFAAVLAFFVSFSASAQIEIVPKLGLNLAILAGATYRFLSDENNETESLTDELKGADFGLNIGAGYRFENYQVQLAYSGSLSSINDIGNNDLRNNTISLSVAYFFELD